MSIPSNLKGLYAYHFTLLDNLESIIESGILSTNMKKDKAVSHKDIAEQGIQCRRSTMAVPCSNGKVVHDYVPFYFSKKTSMQLGVINKKNVDQPLIVYLAIPIEIIETKTGVVFSDASANTDIPPTFFDSSDCKELSSLNWEAINSMKWGCPDEVYRHQKMAELLVPEMIQIDEIAHIVVWNEWVKGEVEKVFKKKGVTPPKIKYDRDHYFINFYDNGRQSIVTGPLDLKQRMEETINGICNKLGDKTKYHDIKITLESIANNFSSIKELDDINGLKASYGPHTDDVGVHSKKVANALSNYTEYKNLNDGDKDIVMLSAYLHDIGKGPKSRWTDSEMTKADNDHAVKSLPMLKRILTEDIGSLDEESIRKIVMLVTYDDLIGDIVAKGRNEQQLFDIIESENDLIMLVALGKSDMSSINPIWVMINNNAIEALKVKAVESLGCGTSC